MSHQNESCHTCTCHRIHSYTCVDTLQWYQSFTYGIYPMHMCHGASLYAMTHPYVCHDSSICAGRIVPCLIRVRCLALPRGHHDACLWTLTHSYVTWLIHMWHDSLICDMTHWYVTWLIDMWHDSSMCIVNHWYVTWLVDMWHDSYTGVCRV